MSNLENNEITSISAFTGLRSPYLKNNNFTTLEYGVLNDLTSLFSCDITNCGLQVSKQKYILVFWSKNSLNYTLLTC